MSGYFEFSSRSRLESIRRLKEESFDVLVIGGGITGVSVARDAVSRGLKVALIEKNDFSSGTSSKSSKLIHGGFRYLENFEWSLVFEALAERAHLLKTEPTLVKPLPFYFPVYRGDKYPAWIMSFGMWFYDVLALFRSPGFHRRLSCAKVAQEIPILNQEKLVAAFQYYDASMHDDLMGIAVARDAAKEGAVIVNYAAATRPYVEDSVIRGFYVQAKYTGFSGEFLIRSKRIIVCGGPWTDILGKRIHSNWNEWLKPSQGVHLVFNAKRFTIPGAVVMTEKRGGRIAFAIPRDDFEMPITIVGTTDAPSSLQPEDAVTTQEEVDYLLSQLKKYFPQANLTREDIVSTYVGVRPLYSPKAEDGQTESLQKISREHHIALVEGGAIFVAGGKYTTARKMATEIMDYFLKQFDSEFQSFRKIKPKTHLPMIPYVTSSQNLKTESNQEVVNQLLERLRFECHTGMVIRLSDFCLRRSHLFMVNPLLGLDLLNQLAEEFMRLSGLDEIEISEQINEVRFEVQKMNHWRKTNGTT